MIRGLTRLQQALAARSEESVLAGEEQRTRLVSGRLKSGLHSDSTRLPPIARKP